jgi:Tfp pilus assembly protein PilV
LIEVMIALVVLSFGLLTLATMQIIAIKQGSAGRHTADASAIARAYLEEMSRVDWAILTTARNAGADTDAFWADAASQLDITLLDSAGTSVTEQSYDVRWTVTDLTSCLRNVTLKISWNEENFVGQKNMRLATRRYNWGAPGC